LGYSTEELGEKNWNEEWEKNFQPVRVNTFCGVRAYFHERQEGVLHEVVITPKMSFGTGHHATTYMMIEAMQQVDFGGRTVLDFGTGTGVLAILAEKLGAAEITAIDNDDWSIANALENVAVNGANRVSVKKMDSLDSTGRFGVILANINKNVILSELPTMTQHLSEGGVILLSGLLEEDYGDIEVAASGHHFLITRKLAMANWICLQLEKMKELHSEISRE
jgi:ribosomal protein L11 methyltransferase